MKVLAGTRVWPVHRNTSDNRLWCAPHVTLTRDVPASITLDIPLSAAFNKFTFRKFTIVTFERPSGSVIGFVVGRNKIR